MWGIDAEEAAYMFQRDSTSTDLPPLAPLTSTSSPLPGTSSTNQGPAGMIIGLSVGFGLVVIIIIGVAILFVIRHYKKSKSPKFYSDLDFKNGEQLSEVVNKPHKNDFRNGEQLSVVVSKPHN